MDLKSLQCFISVAEHLNFSRAAQSLYISQPSLSIRINALEDELGVKLFQRTHQQVYLTDEGAILLPAAREILEKVHSLRFLVNNDKNNNDAPKKLLIGVDTTEDRSLPVFENVFTSFQCCYPDIDLKVIDVSVDEYEQKLLNDELDFCLIVLQKCDPVNSMFLSIPLLTEPMVIVTSDAGNISIDELVRTRELQLFSAGDQDQRWNIQYLDFLKKYAPHIEPIYIKNISLLLRNLAHGKTYTFFPKTYADNLQNDYLNIIPVNLPQGDITLTLLWNKHNINPAIQLLVNEFALSKT